MKPPLFWVTGREVRKRAQACVSHEDGHYVQLLAWAIFLCFESLWNCTFLVTKIKRQKQNDFSVSWFVSPSPPILKWFFLRSYWDFFLESGLKLFVKSATICVKNWWFDKSKPKIFEILKFSCLLMLRRFSIPVNEIKTLNSYMSWWKFQEIW